MATYRRDHYPFIGSYLDLDGLAMHFLDQGSGEPLLMLHGNPTWSFFYRNLILGLRDRFRIIAPDHIGCGFSDKPNENRYEYTLERRVNDLETLVNHLQISQPLTLVLHDWGGMIGMAYAQRHPNRIARLIILNTAAFHLPANKQLPPSLWLCRNTALSDFLIRQTGLFSKLVTYWGTVNPMDKVVRDGYLIPHRDSSKRTGHLRFVQDIPLNPEDPSYDLVTKVQRSLPSFRSTPALILWGEKDFVFDRSFLDVWRTQLPQAQVHVFPEAGHLVLEDIAPQAQELITNFLRDHPINAAPSNML